MKVRNIFLSAAVAVAGLASGCSFSRDWKAASRQPPPVSDLTGAWIGTWRNSNNPHTDQLKAVITRVSDTEYQARFKAWWFGIFSGTFDATLKGRWEGGEFIFEGTQKVMGWEFTQKGQANSTNFTSEYFSSDYRGSFTMERPAPKP